MANFNFLLLIGRIGAAMKESTASNGSKYLYFSIEIQSKQTATSVERNQYQTLHVMVFRKPVMDYLHKVKAHQGNTRRVSLKSCASLRNAYNRCLHPL